MGHTGASRGGTSRLFTNVQLTAAFGIKTMDDVHDFAKMLIAETILTALDAEMVNEPGYGKYNYMNNQTTNSRNGHSEKLFRAVWAS